MTASAMAAARLEDHVRAVVEAAPPLTSEQIERLRALLPAPAAEADVGVRAFDTDGGVR